MAISTHPTIQLIDPTGADPGTQTFALSPRPIDLRGKRLGLLDNSKANSDVILRTIARLLDEEYQFADIYYAKKALRLTAALPRNRSGPASPR